MRRIQKGSVRIKGPSWYGRYVTYGRGGFPKSHEIKLGAAEALTRDDAKALLQKIITKQTTQATIVASIHPAVLSVTRPLATTPGSNSRGAIGECLVAADLLSRGYEVFKPACASSSCDLAYIDNTGKVVRVEVKFTTNGSAEIWRNLGKFDVLAMVDGSGRIQYHSHSDLKGTVARMRPENGTEVGHAWESATVQK